jgi:sterol desaturase/sphingolipid hydroxylase (fatty acid hydroxylase superfamily)
MNVSLALPIDRPFGPTVYLGAIGAAIAMHAVLLAAGAHLLFATYLPILLGAAWVAALERIRPYRAVWAPGKGDVIADLGFMAVVQVAWPKFFGLLLALWLIEPVRALGLPFTVWWPAHWPWLAQGAFALLLIDFIQYWVHRTAHRVSALWRLHAVHHAAPRMYWLNVGRLHPTEKSLQMFCEVVPLLLIGATVEALALYYTVYAVHGFFHHANLDIHFGRLNRWLATTETHRWHHSIEPEESNANFGNVLMLWDRLFGSFFLPDDRVVGRLGVRDARYGRSFWEDMRAPYAGVTSGLRRRLAGVLLMATNFSERRRIERALRDPRSAQEGVLARIVARRADTGFGRAHGFGALRGTAAFRRLPIQQDETLLPWTREQLRGQPALVSEPAIHFVQTSGTTGEPKRLPVTRGLLAGYRRQQRYLAEQMYRANSRAFTGSMLACCGAAEEGRTASGMPVGAVSGYLYAMTPRHVRARFVAPAEIMELADPALKYRLILRLALERRDLSQMVAANPSTLLKLAELWRADAAGLVREVRLGGFEGWQALPESVRRALRGRLRPDPERADALARLDAQARLADLWPGLALVVTWTGGSCGVALPRLKAELPANCQVMDLGYLATEGRFTYAPEAGAESGVPLLTEHYFEFIAPDDWEAGRRDTLELHELSDGREYFIIVTTAGGLTRYFMNDVVRVAGVRGATPLLRFLRKGRGVTSITGEKLTEAQLIEAMDALGRDQPWAGSFYVMVADEAGARYRLYLETETEAENLATGLDASLARLNPEYSAKRDSGRLGAPEVACLRAGAGAAWQALAVGDGQRDAQFKPRLILYARECVFPLHDWATAAAWEQAT